MMRKQNVQNVYDRKCDNQGKHETLKGRKERNERETNKSKEKRPYHPRL